MREQCRDEIFGETVTLRSIYPNTGRSKCLEFFQGRFHGTRMSLHNAFTRVTDTALGTIRSLESTVQGFEERVGRLECTP